ncbi:hypothetical protein CEP52_007281 [Fusarium oligoseptatum]|uniref:Uncharacterized protein n=2 Tax=Fusarium solani species complex TaxID=232080 RepID=A0A428TNK4_9HYPO|nr:hypothetical protein CEP52_007281 [Fusarium oligoseptatum]RSM17025.1 hypothetical protein CDV31_004082 [Fusarium ambrosium]
MFQFVRSVSLGVNVINALSNTSKHHNVTPKMTWGRGGSDRSCIIRLTIKRLVSSRADVPVNAGWFNC